jgi:hypothetical protein
MSEEEEEEFYRKLLLITFISFFVYLILRKYGLIFEII